MAGEPDLEQIDEFRLHEGIVVRDVEADDSRVLEVAFEAFGQPRAVGFFHDDDDVGPFDQFSGAGVVGVGIQAGGGDFEVRARGEDVLGGRAAEFVAAAEEEDAFHEQLLEIRALLPPCHAAVARACPPALMGIALGAVPAKGHYEAVVIIFVGRGCRAVDQRAVDRAIPALGGKAAR